MYYTNKDRALDCFNHSLQTMEDEKIIRRYLEENFSKHISDFNFCQTYNDTIWPDNIIQFLLSSFEPQSDFRIIYETAYSNANTSWLVI